MKSRIQDLRLSSQRHNKLKHKCNKSNKKLKQLWLKKRLSLPKNLLSSKLHKVQEVTLVLLMLKDNNSRISSNNYKESLRWLNKQIKACKMVLGIRVSKCNNSCTPELANSRCHLKCNNQWDMVDKWEVILNNSSSISMVNLWATHNNRCNNNNP
jgi:hypothetical protein